MDSLDGRRLADSPPSRGSGGDTARTTSNEAFGLFFVLFIRMIRGLSFLGARIIENMKRN